MEHFGKGSLEYRNQETQKPENVEENTIVSHVPVSRQSTLMILMTFFLFVNLGLHYKIMWDNFYDSGTNLLSFLLSEDSRLTRNALIKTLRKLSSPDVSKNPNQGTE